MRRAEKARRERVEADRPERSAGDVDTGLRRVMAYFQTHHETSPRLSGGDLDADWLKAHLYGDEAVGGSVATPDQDMVDEIGRALGVEEENLDAEVRSFDDVIRQRDRHRWALEEDAAADEGRE